MPDVDVAILGGGCAGLSLALRLARTDCAFCVLEPRSSYGDDRTWSFWSADPAGLPMAVKGSWSRWSVAGPRGVTERRSDALRYWTLSGAAFYERAQSVVADSSAGMLSLGTRALRVSRHGAGFLVATSGGTLSARHVVDTRPPARRPRFGQFFLGREIVTDRPAFDPRRVQLMHFRSGHSDGVDFLYVLPFAADRALVEVTSFARNRPADLPGWLNREVHALSGGRHETVREEAGALPMEVGYGEAPRDGVARLGLAGGAARPSTGYAFQRIQAQADRVAAQLQAGEPLRPPRDSAVTRFMDGVFLRVLAQAPDRGPALFQSLFANVPPDRLERFLSGSIRPRDRLSVMAALPPRPFLAASLGGP